MVLTSGWTLLGMSPVPLAQSSGGLGSAQNCKCSTFHWTKSLSDNKHDISPPPSPSKQCHTPMFKCISMWPHPVHPSMTPAECKSSRSQNRTLSSPILQLLPRSTMPPEAPWQLYLLPRALHALHSACLQDKTEGVDPFCADAMTYYSDDNLMQAQVSISEWSNVDNIKFSWWRR
jgi:hypothetical protein